MNLSILLVDDEGLQLHLLRQVLINLRPSYHITAVSSALEALKILAAEPFDVLITDVKMPEIDGLTLVGRLRELGLHDLHIIILSGFDDFSYAQQAIRYGVKDYLLKPIKYDSLQNTLEKLEQTINKSHTVSQENKQQTLEWLLIKRLLNFALSQNEQYTINTWQKEDALLTFVVVQWANSCPTPNPLAALLQGDQGAICFPMEGAKSVYIYPFHSGLKTKKTMEALGAALGDYHAIWVLRDKVLFRNIADAYCQLQALLENAAFVNKTGLVYQKEQSLSLEDFWQSLHELNDKLFHKACFSLQYQLMSASTTVEETKQLFIDAADQLFTKNAQLFHTQQQAAEKAAQYERQIKDACLFSELLALFHQLFSQIKNMRSQADTLKENCIIYIKANYMHEITLGAMAESFHYNPSYFSHLFKEAFSCTFTKMVTKVRMEQAAALLLETNLPATQVAKNVGISDSGYFNKLFRDAYQMTPKRFRQFHKKQKGLLP